MKKKTILITLLIFLIAALIYSQKNLISSYLNAPNYEKKSPIVEEEIEIDPKLLVFMKAKYYVDDNLDRYLAYQERYPDKLIEDIIKEVNSEIDYDFYSNIYKADTSKGHLTLVNKHSQLEKDYVPANLVAIGKGRSLDATAFEALKELYEEASKSGIYLEARSAYRSYNNQIATYNHYLRKNGRIQTDKYSARPGHSEHQLGLAIDFTIRGTNSFLGEGTKAYQWLINNAHNYGFILRYPKDKEYLTGYMFEPWHFRYLGKEAAKKIFENNLTFEEYYAYYLKNK